MISGSLSVALERLREYPVRVGLSAAGVCVATATMVVLANLVESAYQASVNNFAELGAQLVVLASNSRPADAGAGPPVPIGREDLEALRSRVSGVDSVVTLFTVASEARACGGKLPVTLIGVVPQQARLASWTTSQGRLINAVDVTQVSAVAVLGNEVAQRLPCLSGPAPFITVANRAFEVVGQLKPQAAVQIRGEDIDLAVLVPFSVAERMFARAARTPMGALIVLKDQADLRQTVEEIRRLLRFRHRLPSSAPDDFRLQTQDDLYAAMAATANLSWSLVIASIGILNSIYTSVVERTTEIGLRRAVGATRHHVVAEFMWAGLATATSGATMGVLLGLGVSTMIASWLDLPPTIDWSVVALAQCSSSLMGLAAASWPAWRAGQLQPYDAVRHE